MAYTCPMHPDVEKIHAGICPVCGMNLVPGRKPKGERRTHEGQTHEYDKHSGHSTASFARKFWASLALTVPVVLYSDIAAVLGIAAPEFPGSPYVPPVFGSVVFFSGGWVFLAGAWRELRARMPGMMTLIGLAISVAYVYSVYVTLTGGDGALYWELTTLITVMLLGHWMEMRAVSGAQGALAELSKLLPDTAEVLRPMTKAEGHGGDPLETNTVLLAELKAGDLLLVRPGAKIPADGVVVEGSSEVNESLITGESKPVGKSAGSAVIAGAINGDGSLRIRVTEIGERTFLAGIQRLIAEAQASKSRLQLLSDRAAFYLTVVAVLGGLLTFVLWLSAGGGAAFAIERMVAVLVIACPHALGLAIPLVATISTTLASRSGFLVRDRRALESARSIDTVLFDKTGTLTTGAYGVRRIVSMSAVSEPDILRLGASVDALSEHPIAKAVVAAAHQRGIQLGRAEEFKRLPGAGAEARVGNALIGTGGEAMLRGAGDGAARTPASLALTEERERGSTIIYVLRDGILVGWIALADIIRPESRQAVAALKAMGLRVAMVTGDAEDVAIWVARELAVDEWFSRVRPEEKAEKVRLLQMRGQRVAMVGDGINDAPALTQADLGIAIGAGTNVAIESAGIILVRNDPRDIVKIIKLSRLTYAKMIQNLFWATGYNVVALPLAAGVLVSKGILLEPAVAAFLMSLSTVIVALNALLLRRKILE